MKTDEKINTTTALVILLMVIILVIWGYSTLVELMYYLDEIEQGARYGDPTFKVVKYLQ